MCLLGDVHLIAVLLGETHFDGQGQESNPEAMEYVVTIENHDVHSRAASYRKIGWRTNTSYA